LLAEVTGDVTVSDQAITDAVVHAAGLGDHRAFAVIYDDLAGAVCGYLRAKGVADPEAVTSDVFLGVLPRLGQVVGGAVGLRKLVFSIAHARMVDDHRGRARRPAEVDYVPATDRREVRSAEDEAHVGLGTEWVLATLGVLPHDQREVLLLRLVADLTLEQVAEIIGRSTGAVKQLQRRGLRAIRLVLEEGRVTL
jgi:RNA polymerase sigma factor (sigma-70 family)